MKKTTLNQIVNIKTELISAKQSLSLFIKRVSYILVFFTSIAFGQSNNCKANLIVENNGYIRSTPLDGTYYSMILTNTGNSSDTYMLTSNNVNSTCTNNDDTSTASNVVVNTDFIDSNRTPITEITVNSGESVNFYVHITVPIGTTINKWSCTQIIAESKTCANYKVDTVLHTFVINPSKD